MKSERLSRWIIAIPLAILAIGTLYPLIFSVNISMMSKQEYVIDRLAPAQQFTIANFVDAWEQSNMGTYMVNSITVTAGSVAILLLLGSMAGYAFAQLTFRGSRVLFLLTLAALMIPFQVIMVPFIKIIGDVGLLDTHAGLILAYVGQFLPFTIFLMTSHYTRIPKEVTEAARVDGASPWGVYWRVMLPLGRPALLSVGILNALYCWNDVLIALLVMRSNDTRTVMVGVSALRGQYPDNMPTFIAGVLIAALPLIVVYLLFQRQITDGVTAGAVKG
jgi:ABC-type glycerol-3-phosphate transport system permease component